MKIFIKGLVLLLTITLLFVSCSPRAVEYMTRTHFDLVNKEDYQQTKGGITVILKPLSENKGVYNKKVKLVVKKFLQKKRSVVENEYKLNYFYKMLPFEVTIINDTKHILRMRDARIVYIDPDSDEPIFALTKSQIIENIEELPIYEDLKRTIINNHKLDEIYSDLDEVATKVLSKIAKKLKFINGFNKEIMPGMRTRGIVLFNIDPEVASEGKISFVDMTAETDDAGNPTKKVRFDYRVKPITKRYKYDPNTGDWEEVNSTDYKQTSFNQNETTSQETNNYRKESTRSMKEKSNDSQSSNYQNNSYAQKGKMAVSGQVGISVPVGDYGDAAKTGFGLIGNFVYTINRNIDITGTLGYLSWSGESISDDFYKYDQSYSDIPLLGSIRYYLNREKFSPYGIAELGLHFLGYSVEIRSNSDFGSFNNSSSDSKTEFGFGIGGGFLYNIGNMNLDVNAKYTNTSGDSFFNHFAIMAGILFPLK